ncbi:transporter [Rhizobiales bacterium RZME27]|uniref:Transporter n=2 Tax=Endobacterium cereale TaxID=2663029 RepID=A0A6A8AGX0_9HYPH|nr:transporter [Endobacterium cereale]
MKSTIVLQTTALLLACSMRIAYAQDADLAKQLSNPVASLISVPFQFNYDRGYGPQDGHRSVLNIQPVVPISLNEDWNVISRTIIPVIWQDDVAGESGSQFGLGDVLQSFFFSPKQPTAGGLIWGVGPAFLLPTATDPLLGSEKFGLGPTVVLLKQDSGFTYGALVNHIWSVAGDSSRADISSTFLQPFVSYTTPDAWTFTLNTESSYDWKNDEWAVPVNVSVAKLVKLGEQPVSFQVGARYWASSPDNGAEGWAFRAGVTLLFPK